jgi:heptosyltransferase-3
MSDLDLQRKHRILAVRGGALGDFILTLPSVRAIRHAGHEVALLTRPAYGRLAQDSGFVSGWRDLGSPEAAPLTVRGAEIAPDWHRWLAGFDAVVSWVPDPDGAFRHQIRRAGVPVFCQGDGRCSGSGPAAKQLAGVLPDLGVGGTLPDESLLFPCGGTPRRPGHVAFHPGSGSLLKNWPLDRWMLLLQKLQRRCPETTWQVITGEAEEDRLPAIHGAMNSSGLPWQPWHGIELTNLVHRLQECRAFLGHDSGISHLAAACGVPCRLLFGPTDPAVWAPMGGHVRVLRGPGTGSGPGDSRVAPNERDLEAWLADFSLI